MRHLLNFKTITALTMSLSRKWSTKLGLEDQMVPLVVTVCHLHYCNSLLVGPTSPPDPLPSVFQKAALNVLHSLSHDCWNPIKQLSTGIGHDLQVSASFVLCPSLTLLGNPSPNYSNHSVLPSVPQVHQTPSHFWAFSHPCLSSRIFSTCLPLLLGD